VAALAFGLKHRGRLALACGLGAVGNGLVMAVALWPWAPEPTAGGPRLRLVAVNVQRENTQSDRVIEFVRRVDADLVVLIEVDDRWLADLAPLNATYPHRIVEAREDNFGIAVFSRLHLEEGRIVELGEAEVPSIAANVRLGAASVALLATHPVPPSSAENARLRNEQLRRIADHARAAVRPAVVLGDLNCTPWSPWFRALIEASGLRAAGRGWRLGGTWPAWLPLGRIRLDYGLVDPRLTVLDAQIGPRVGGDHLPVIVDLLAPGLRP
jgi:endonuclease/exonuclease/phosphatase (EEP) superfamily protein YafD